jgi:hypothetical protein
MSDTRCCVKSVLRTTCLTLLEERPTGVEPVIRAWKALVLPLHHGRVIDRD